MSEVMVTIADLAIPKFTAIVEQCERAGMQVSQKLPTLGVIVGKIRSEKISELAQMTDVIAVEQTQSYQLPPPDSEPQ